MKNLYLIILGIALIGASGCSTTCKCGCPYCCGGNSTDYNNPSNKPAPDIPIWWENDNSIDPNNLAAPSPTKSNKIFSRKSTSCTNNK